MKRLFGLISLAGFTAALIVHVLALTGVDVSEHFPAVWGLHGGIFLVFIPFVFFSRKTLGPKPTFAEIRNAFPMWVVVLGCGIFAYALLNFALTMVGSEVGNPSIVDGKYVLVSHGKHVRELTALEYSAFKANEIRGFSGHWLAFYFMPFAYFMFGRDSSTIPADAWRRR
ncbi:hypothetical protein [Pseudoduganella violaceinigra]|uniref:hypothetical protein n=1 Tax=Pseudoduganella violaceinigra TaxID=246602 RepID=UPI0012B5913B|nr:hypothetical protein [Pseudoduganella violaceinigra]